MRKGLKQQEGVVIVVALFFLALVATMAYLMMTRLERDTRRTSLLVHDTQAEFYAQGSIDWAIEQLRDNLAKQKPNVIVDIMPVHSPKNEMNGYVITSHITDMQARINLNNLTTTEAQADFKRLLQLVSPEMNEQKAQEVTLALVDWITPVQQQNEYSKYYLSLPLPYRAAHRPMTSVSELQLVKGMTPALYAALQQYITALPASTLINVQTAPAHVLAALSPKMTVETAKTVEKVRTDTKMTSIEAFLNLDVIKNHAVPAEKITVISNYFLVETTVAIEKQKVVLYTLLERTGKDNKGSISVIWQSKSVSG